MNDTKKAEPKALIKRGAAPTKALTLNDTESNRRALISRFGNEFSTALTPQQFIGLCNVYALNPFVSHCAVIHGRFYIERDGWMHLIQREAKGELVGVDTRPATPDEYEQYNVTQDDFFAVATIIRQYPNRNQCSFTRRAIITRAQVQATEAETQARDRGSKARHIVEDPWDMVEKQALVRALRMGFGDCLRRLEAIAGDVTVDEVREDGQESPKVDKSTGEIIEGKAATPENGLDWSRLWAIANEAGMDRADVHNFFKVPDHIGALRDTAYARAGVAKVAPVQIVADMADELEADIRGQQPDHGPEPEAEPEPES